MTTVLFLAEWALRSSVLVLSGALLLWLLRVKDPATRLAAWTAILAGSLAIPALTAILPTMAFRMPNRRATVVAAPVGMKQPSTVPVGAVTKSGPTAVVALKPFPWVDAVLAVYGGVALLLLLRLAAGLRASRRLRRHSRAIPRSSEGIRIYETELVVAPVTLGILDPVIVLPADWREWDAGRLEAVLAHERAHVRRHDPAIQVISVAHRGLLWFSPLSWFLHTRLVRTAEEASDDAALAAVRDRVFYAEVLLDFTRRGVRKAEWLGVPMARYDRPDQRIHRILDGTTLSRGITRWAVAAILGIGSPLVYSVAAARAQDDAKPVEGAQGQVIPAPGVVRIYGSPGFGAQGLVVQAPGMVQLSAPPARPQSREQYLTGMGTAVPSASVAVKSRVEGQLRSINFKEGDTVEAGQLLATVDSSAYELRLRETQAQLLQAETQLKSERSKLAAAQQLLTRNMLSQTAVDEQEAKLLELEAQLRAQQDAIQAAEQQVSYTRIVAPISGIVGFRKIDVDNMVHPDDATPIVTINQLKPITVVFDISQDSLPLVRARLAEGKGLTVEALSRNSNTRLAVGRVVAVDNQIDPTSGTVKLKAEFENKDGALYPFQTVNVRLLLPQ
ncbi:MAG TPA: efflux RND transporter periplasmic adaptor subunit [Bryobacteraceae bacterium]|nr:efflux RND transporter periplasmic adaptor subunit [Bryobacteraceae bacterium]